MSNPQWKRTERAIARLLGGRRVPVAGRQRGDVPDIAHPWLSIECKERQQLPAWLTDAMTQAQAAAGDDQLPVAVMHTAGRQYTDALIVVRLSNFMLWFGDSAPSCRAQRAPASSGGRT